MLLLLGGLVQAASLDQLEVGGPWGSPADTGGSAIWWSPGALAGQDGTRVHLEAAPVLAEMRFDRAEPNAGSDRYTTTGVVPHLSVATDLGRERIGPGKLALGAGLVVPIARGSASQVDNGVGRYAMVDGQSQAIYAMGGLAYRPVEWISIGVVGGAVRSSWQAISDKDTMPSLAQSIQQAGGSHSYTDDQLEDPDYSVRADFDLADLAWTGGAGVWLRPHEMVTISASYLHGVTVDNSGPVQMDFQCPPQTDTGGRYVAESNGICDSRVNGEATVSYRLPARVNAGLAVQPNEKLRLEAMGGWVRWSEYTDFEITVRDPVSVDGQLSEATVQNISGTTWQARDNENAYWGGLDAKLRPVPFVTVGGRAIFDSGAVPDHALSPNNYAARLWMFSGLLAGHLPEDKLTLGFSYTYFLIQERSTTESAFYMSLEDPPEHERWEYPHRAGTYNSDIHRIGIHVRAAL